MKVLNYVVLANILKEHSLMFGVINPNSQVETICVRLNLTELVGWGNLLLFSTGEQKTETSQQTLFN